MNKPLRLLLRQATYNLRGGFLVRPLAIALALGCAGAMLSWLEETFPAFSYIAPKTLFPSHSDPQVAQFILGGIAGSGNQLRAHMGLSDSRHGLSGIPALFTRRTPGPAPPTQSKRRPTGASTAACGDRPTSRILQSTCSSGR
jgi:hypothetical protein